MTPGHEGVPQKKGVNLTRWLSLDLPSRFHSPTPRWTSSGHRIPPRSRWVPTFPSSSRPGMGVVSREAAALPCPGTEPELLLPRCSRRSNRGRGSALGAAPCSPTEPPGLGPRCPAHERGRRGQFPVKRPKIHRAGAESGDLCSSVFSSCSKGENSSEFLTNGPKIHRTGAEHQGSVQQHLLLSQKGQFPANGPKIHQAGGGFQGSVHQHLHLSLRHENSSEFPTNSPKIHLAGVSSRDLCGSTSSSRSDLRIPPNSPKNAAQKEHQGDA